MQRNRFEITVAGLLAAAGVLLWGAVAVGLTVDPPAGFGGRREEAHPPPTTYAVVGDRLQGAESDQIAGELWQRVVQLVPAEERTMVGTFGTISDDETSGYVEAIKGDTGRWHLGLHPDLVESPHLLDAAIVHELAHLFTLSSDQVPTPETRLELRRLADTCETWFTGDGCSLDDSYMAAWVEEFWPDDLLEEWEEITNEDGLSAFVDDHEDLFVTDYAAASPSEDIAESFAEYVLGLGGDHLGEVAREKLAFFDRFPELAALRLEIRSRR